MNILSIGVGLIGGSFNLALKEAGNYSFAGYDLDQGALDQAMAFGIIDRKFQELQDAVAWADVIILAIPVKAIREQLPRILDLLRKDQVVLDFGSTKETICKNVQSHPNRGQFVAAHPIAGTEHSGPGAAFKELYQDKNLILCDTQYSDAEKVALVENLAENAGFYITKMDAAEHDRHLAYISHLSHITSYVLSNTVLEKERDGEVILELAGSGFESTVRLAKSSPAMWSSIFMENKEMVLKGIQAYKAELEKLEHLIQNDQESEISKYLEEGRVIRKILK